MGPKETPYSGGVWKLSVFVPQNYPFDPPNVKFLTPIYHPNIDTGGRICLDTLNKPPKGAWRPSLNIAKVLQSIQLLLSSPNPDDPLMEDISAEFRANPPAFRAKAVASTKKHAMLDSNPGSGSDSTSAAAAAEGAGTSSPGRPTDAAPADEPEAKRAKTS